MDRNNERIAGSFGCYRVLATSIVSQFIIRTCILTLPVSSCIGHHQAIAIIVRPEKNIDIHPYTLTIWLEENKSLCFSLGNNHSIARRFHSAHCCGIRSRHGALICGLSSPILPKLTRSLLRMYRFNASNRKVSILSIFDRAYDAHYQVNDRASSSACPRLY